MFIKAYLQPYKLNIYVKAIQTNTCKRGQVTSNCCELQCRQKRHSYYVRGPNLLSLSLFRWQWYRFPVEVLKLCRLVYFLAIFLLAVQNGNFRISATILITPWVQRSRFPIRRRHFGTRNTYLVVFPICSQWFLLSTGSKFGFSHGNEVSPLTQLYL